MNWKAAGFFKPRAMQKILQAVECFQAFRPFPETGHGQNTGLHILVRQGKRQIKSVSRCQGAQTIRPFDQKQGILRGLIPTQFFQLFGIIDPV